MKVSPQLLALSYSTIDESTVLNTIVNWVCAVILAVGIIYGGWELAQGFMDDSPAKKKHGVTVMIVGVTIAGVIFTIMQMIVPGVTA